MNCSLAIFTLLWAFIWLYIPESEARIKDPRERRVYQKLKQQDCGVLTDVIPTQRLRRRIIGGGKSSLMSQPWMAFLYVSNNLEMCRCGGTLISARFVLTAAHCIKLCPKTEELRVRLGELDLNTSTDCTTYDYQPICAPPVEEYTIEKWTVHEDFDLFSGWNDVALLRLSRKVIFKDHIRPICLPLNYDLLKFTSSIGETYLAVGWGKMEDQDFANSTMEVYINTKECSGGRDSSFLCADGLYVDTCTGDSGGPLTRSALYFGAVRTVQFGVVSTGSNACGAGQNAYYMDVPTFVPWILAKLAEFPNL
ncbi:serine protease grass-like [Drosophila rhopaloa]|uniref:Serine protease easter-like n=1 Tax=Drosophila rhopaloa TaxID=1041015 RepID=A0A6P4EBG3_DRORH|nr:serine protease grass-like [Drosophila rhopaloa]XP_044317672.1 serine protease grass-like [Drosophila rhopaloa]